MVFKDSRTYEILRWITVIVLPAIGTLYFALHGLWNLPYATQIIGTLDAIAVFMGTVLQISRSAYNKEQGEEKK